MRYKSLLLCFLLLSGCTPPVAEPEKNIPILRTCMQSDLTSLDPRKGVAMSNQSVVRMLFTGLVRTDSELIPQLELAQAYRVENDFKTYIFTLKDCSWSDGSPITAHDFVETWRAALSPNYSSANTNLFFHIKNAHKVFLGELPTDHLGARAVDDKTLVVELEQPNAFFLNVLLNSIFSPVHKSMWNLAPENKHLITSGPFCLKKYLMQDQIILEKNQHYWNASQVQLQEIHFYIIKDSSTALNMFQKQQIDWMGTPLSPVPADSIPSFKKSGSLYFCPMAGTQWMFLNTSRSPLNNANIRKALCYAIDRKTIMRDILHLDEQNPSLGLIPKVLKKERWHPWFKDHDIQQAKILFNLGLEELGITAEQFSEITIRFASGHSTLAAIQQMWRETLGIQVKLEASDGPVLMNNFYSQKFDILWLGWVLQYNDPSNMLDIFKLKTVQPNHTGWEHLDYIQHTNKSHVAKSEQEKWDHIEAAEQIFIDEMPSIPVTDSNIFYLKQPYVKNLPLNPLCFIDFDHCTVER